MACVFLALTPPASAQIPGRAIVLSIYGAPPAAQSGTLPGATHGLMWSADSGRSWKGAGWTTYHVNAFLRTSGCLLQATDGGILRSADAGSRWTLVTDWRVPPVVAIASHRGVLWAATAAGPWRSTDDGRTWTDAMWGLASAAARDIAGMTFDGDVLIAATADGLHRFDDAAQTWRPAGLQGRRLDGVVASGGRMAAFSADSGLWLASVEAPAWQRAAAFPSPRVQAVVFHPRSPGILLVGTRDMGAMRSIDGGATWSTTGGMSIFNVTAFAFDPADPEMVVAGTENGAYLSHTGGRTWQATPMRIGYVSQVIMPEEER